ncbi:ubiquinone biosynthesis protein [Acetomicrobium thermoterrenum DSM 13490]|uniref:Ubiquinone biosynthesis protein n=1 Tax=Acetomicrobium thermoterrenum DSM 13490 TaxID=1120987 RepID=A0A1H3E7T4_9BACT|nr:AarF/UbiB family protein [Acetomicrobium thermoterrenum]SDX73949.1 ubiquinone biosynthesis protein [Acetomicrobium thermoterrenum DSM 13490]
MSILTRGSELTLNAIPLFIKLRRLSLRSYKTIPEDEVSDIKNRFEHLGPSFIKLGQMLSCHYDVLPPIIAEALSHLLDELPPSPPPKVFKLIQDELGDKLDEISFWDPQPIGAASLAQVHKCDLKDGRVAAMKILRPDVEQRIEEDIKIMRFLVKRLPDSQSFPIDLKDTVDEFSSNIIKELDLLRELACMRKYGEGLPAEWEVKVPKGYAGLCTKNILTMSFHNGQRLDRAVPHLSRFRRHHMALSLAKTYLYKFLKEGLVHTDPHFGNILVDEDEHLVLLDYGATTFLSEKIRHKSMLLFWGLLRRDISLVYSSLASLGVIQGQSDPLAIENEIYDFLEDYLHRPLGQLSLPDMLKDMIAQSPIWGIKIPKPLLYQVKALSMLEGTLHTLDPEIGFEELLNESFQEVTSILHLQPILFMELGKEKVKQALFDISMTTTSTSRKQQEKKGDTSALGMAFLLSIFGIGFMALPQGAHPYWFALWLFASLILVRR